MKTGDLQGAEHAHAIARLPTHMTRQRLMGRVGQYRITSATLMAALWNVTAKAINGLPVFWLVAASYNSSSLTNQCQDGKCLANLLPHSLLVELTQAQV